MKSSTTKRGELMFSCPTEVVSKKTAKLAQRVISNYSAKVTEAFHAFPLL